MKFEITSNKRNPLMKREEYMVSIGHEGKPTPSRQEILETLAKEAKKDKSLVIVDSIFTQVGGALTNVKAYVYEKAEEIPKGKLEKMKSRSKKSAAAQTPEEPAAEEGQPEAEAAGEQEKPDETPKEQTEPVEGQPEEKKE